MKRVTVKSSSRNARFQRGSGCFECECCHKLTRDTGGDNASVRLCAACYDKATDENAVSDGYMTEEAFDAKWNRR